MTASGSPSERAHPGPGPVEWDSPFDLTTLARMATRIFNDSAGGPVSETVAAASTTSQAEGPSAQAAVSAEDGWSAGPAGSGLPSEHLRPAQVPASGGGGWAPLDHDLRDPRSWTTKASSSAAPSDFYFVESPEVSTDFPGLRAAARTPEGASPGPHFYFVDPAGALSGTGGDALFDVDRVRRDFPILSETVNGHRLVWLDNAATTQKPQAVIDRLAWYYSHENSNVHRGAHELATRSTDAYEAARETVGRFLGASSSKEIVFTRGATEAINLVAQSWGARNLAEGDEIVISHLEHHANIVPWQQIAAVKGAHLKVIPVDDTGQLILEELANLLTSRTRLVAVAHVSNALGTVVPVDEVVKMARTVGARVLVDGAQSVAHMRINLQEIDPDFFVFSGHKVFGPTGIGALWAKSEVLADMPPWQGGGNMIRDVTFDRTLYQDPPGRFEAGTGNIADAVGLGTALDYLEQLGIERVRQYEDDLLAYATAGLAAVPGLRQVGTASQKASVLSFVLDGYTPEEVGTALNDQGIAVRAGHHCAQPILRRFGLEATVRPSLALYNTRGEVDQLVSTLTELSRRRPTTRI